MHAGGTGFAALATVVVAVVSSILILVLGRKKGRQ
jgi:hypothetical protein